jgi:ABC-2 type transport system ATP-binding protein
VHEYLSFIGKLYGLSGSQLKLRVAEMIDLCGLQREQNKRIEALSKGYRQRVGLAQALIHDPKILILDEPTSGLDPNQLVEIRRLIKEISRNKTVMFSTHIMQEVEALCDRVIVINLGEIVADNELGSLMSSFGARSSIVVEFEGEVLADELHKIRGVEEVKEIGPRVFRLTTRSGNDLRPEVFRFAADQNLSMVGLRQEENSLEEIFRSLTHQQGVRQ